MNSTNYKQYDTRWALLGYPRKPWYIRNCGCGEVAMCNAIIDMATQKSQTPKTIQPYMVQFAEARGNGTYHSGIPTAMKHYGLTEVAEHATMPKLWEQLKKGNRIAILLMGSRLGGSKKVKWTGSGHFIAITGYKEQNGKHYVYVKDSASESSLRNGWITYEENIKGACLKCWSGKLNGTTVTTTTVVTTNGKLAVDGIGGEATVKALQKFLGTTQDGVISGQNQSYAKYYPSLKSVKFGKGGSVCVTSLQKWLGISQDGIWGQGTSKALQKKLSVTQDGIFGTNSMKALQTYLNNNDKAVYPTQSKAQQINDKAVELAWASGTKTSKYAYKGGSPTAKFKEAWQKYFPNKKNNAGCHQAVSLVLKTIGYPTMPMSKWNDILTYLKKNFNQVSFDYKQSQLKAGDIWVRKDVKNGKTSYHIMIIVKIGGKLMIAEAQQGKTYFHINQNISKALKKHNQVWIFRAE